MDRYFSGIMELIYTDKLPKDLIQKIEVKKNDNAVSVSLTVTEQQMKDIEDAVKPEGESGKEKKEKKDKE